MIDGVVVVDKPRGLTSHDVVAVARRVLRAPRVGHTGTLDPMATGVLPLACGHATRLVRFLAASDKDYDAEIRLGLTTDTYDVTGREVMRSDRQASRDEIVAALGTLTGDYLQSPPPYSAKKIGGRRAYDLARADAAVQPAAVAVTVRRLDVVDVTADVVAVKLTCSAGFYVRALAHDLGVRLGTGACLQALRRTRSGEFGLSEAIRLELLSEDPEAAAARLVPMEQLLPAWPVMTLTEQGTEWASHGRVLGKTHVVGPIPAGAAWVRLLRPNGSLMALAEPAGLDGSLHPSIVLI
jgi:tRNA pseudouridine55 synthase